MEALYNVDLGYTEITVFENYFINKTREGATIESDHCKALKKIVDEYYPKKRFIYISNRVNSYSVDPLLYLELDNISNLIYLIIIASTEIKKKAAEFETIFCKKPIKIVTNMDGAILYTQQQIKIYDKKSVF